ncbi:polymorphic toxin-type HINT domain-containing protein [Microscilla marina]|uniref:Intein C-terminal splicing region domain protein n=1 Tax=Microscilla marina ATCC 23134 TaxID=313606 RepID=A1ZPS0_MICM2|nr:polymorphic toxin-type HINT domain-containing protein [Microscilla marina]EAY27575.1 hypothetical protein M23134_02822 [Microscilla marina ATCC 23134]
MRKKLTGILAIILLAISFGLQATDTTYVAKYKDNKRVEQMVILLNQQIARNAYLPTIDQNYVIDGKFEITNQRTFGAQVTAELNEQLKKLNEAKEATKQVDFYVIIPPPIIQRSTDIVIGGKGNGTSANDIQKKGFESNSIKESIKAAYSFTRQVYQRSKLASAKRIGLLLNLDSFIGVFNNKKREYFFPCLAFGNRLSAGMVKRGVQEVMERLKQRSSLWKTNQGGSVKGQNMTNLKLDKTSIIDFTKVCISTMQVFIGTEVFAADTTTYQFKSNIETRLSQLSFTNKAAIIARVKTFDKKHLFGTSNDRLVVEDYAGVLDPKTFYAFFKQDSFLKQFLSKKTLHDFTLEVFTTSDASVEASRTDFASDIKGKTAHQLAYERPLAPKGVRISLHFRYEKGQKVITQWVMRLGEALWFSKGRKTIKVIPVKQPTIKTFDDFVKVSLAYIKGGLELNLNLLKQLKIDEKVWNNPDLEEPGKTIYPLLIGVYNGLIDQVASVPESILEIIGLLNEIARYAVDKDYRAKIDQALAKLKDVDLQKILDDKIAEEQKKLTKINNPSYYLGNMLTQVIIEVITGKGLVKVLKESVDTFKKRNKKKGKGKDGDNNKGKGKQKKPEIIVNNALLAEYVTYKDKKKVKSKTTVGKGQTTTKEGEKLLTINKLQKKGTYSKAYVIKKIVDKAFKKPTKLKGIFATSENTEVGRWAKSKGYQTVKIKGGVKFVKAPTIYVFQQQYRSKATWIAVDNQHKNNKAEQKHWLYTASFKKNGKEARLLYFEKKQAANSYQNKPAIFEAIYAKINAKYKVTSIFIPKTNKSVFEVVRKGGNIEELRAKDKQKQLKGDVISWALRKKKKNNNKTAFNYAFITYGKKGIVDGVKLTRTACFPAGTPIFLGISEDTGKPHYAPIETIRSGDVVPSFKAPSGKVNFQQVKGVSQSIAEELIKVYAGGKLALMPTPEHPFWVASKWLAASELKQGDSLWLFNGQQVAIDSVVRIDTVVRVYNFEVAHNHTYFVGELGVGVHNNCAEEALEEALDIVGQAVLSNIAEVSKEEFLDESDQNYEYFYRAMGTNEFYSNGMGLIVGKYDEDSEEWLGEPSFVASDLQYLIASGSGKQQGLLRRSDQQGVYQVVVKYKMKIGTTTVLDENSVNHGTSGAKIKKLIKKRSVSRKREGERFLGYKHYTYGFHADIANDHFHPHIVEIVYVKVNNLID